MSKVAVPSGWDAGTISDIAIVNPPVPVSSLNDNDAVSFLTMADVGESGRILNHQVRQLREVRAGFTRFEEGDVLFAKITPCMENGKGAFARNLVNRYGFGSTEFHVLRANYRGDAEFVFHLSQSNEVRTKAIAFFTGSAGQQRVDAQFFSRFPLLIPPPAIQRKIARILTTLDNLIEKTEALIAKYQAIKQGLMHDLFTRGVDEHGHLRSPHAEAPHLYKQSALGWIPKAWEVVRVDAVGSVQLGRQRSPKHQSGRFTTPYFRVANVFDGWIDYSDVLQMDFTPRERDSYSVLPGDILLNEGQSLELVGRCAVYEGEPGRYCFQNTLVRFRAYSPNSFQFCRGLFKHWLDTGRFTTVARQTTSVAHLGADRFARMSCPRPTGEEQARIGARIVQLDSLVLSHDSYLGKLRRTKNGLMQDLLTGRVRVEPDGGEEVTNG